jgi:RNA recognition motif-containing protein
LWCAQGFGFVRFDSDNAAQAAISTMNGQPFGAKNLIVEAYR